MSNSEPSIPYLFTAMSPARFLTLAGLALCLLTPAWSEVPGIEKVRNPNLKRELKALDDAAETLAAVNDEASAKKAIIKLTTTFSRLPPTIDFGGQQIMLMWAQAQNRVSFQMMRLKEEPYFEKLKLQELWTLISDPFSRPSAER